jgi:hypothetical protein
MNKIYVELDIHKNKKYIPEEYKALMLHIALERADKNKDWKLSPIFLKRHLIMTSIFHYNYLKLSTEEQNNLFKI